MSKVKTAVSGEIEMDGDSILYGQVKFSLGGKNWVGYPERALISCRVREWVQALKYVEDEFQCTREEAIKVVEAALLHK